MDENDLQEQYNALRRQGLSRDEAIDRLNASRGVSVAPERREQSSSIGRALTEGLKGTAASLAGAAGYGIEKLGGNVETARALSALQERVEEGRPEFTGPAQAAYLASRLGSEVIGSGLGAGAALKGATKVPALARALSGASRVQRGLAGAAATLPIDALQAAAYREGVVLPGFGGALAENVALSGAAGALLPAMRAPAREAAAEFDIRAPLRQEEVPLRRLATPSPQEVERFGERALSTQEAIEAAAAARAAEPEGIVVEGYRRRSPQEQAALMRQLIRGQDLAEEVSRRQRMAGPSEEASALLEAAAQEGARLREGEGLVRTAYTFPSPLEALLTGRRAGAPEMRFGTPEAPFAQIAEPAIEAAEEVVAPVLEAAPTLRATEEVVEQTPSQLLQNVPIVPSSRKRQGFLSTTDTAEEVRRVGRQAKTKIFDRNAPLIRLFELVGGEKAALRAQGLIGRLDGAVQSAEAKIKREYKDFFRDNSDRLNEISKAAAVRADVSNRNYIQRLIKSRDEALERIRAGIPEEGDQAFVDRIPEDIAEYAEVTKIAGYTADQVDAAYEEVMNNPYLREKTDELMGFFRDILEKRRAAGLITEDEYRRIVASDDYYTPLYREYMQEVTGSGVIGAGGRLTPSKGVRAMKRLMGRETGIQDPMEVLLGERFRLEKDIRKQDIQNFLAEAIDYTGGEGIPGLIRRLRPGESASQRANVFTATVDGQPIRYEVADKELFDAITQQSTYAQGFLMDVMRGLGNTKRAAITLVPDFSMMAIMRDLPVFTIQRGAQALAREGAIGGVAGGVIGAATAEEGERLESALRGIGFGISAGALARPAIEIGNAVAQIAKRSDAFQEFLEEGGSTAGIAIQDPTSMRKLLNSLSKDERSSILNNIVNPARWLDGLRFIGMAAENAPRLAEFTRARAAGVEIPEAVWAAQNITLPFARKGSSQAIRTAAEITPFFNAQLRGWVKFGELFKDPKTSAQTLATAGSVITAPTIALWTVNKDNPEYWEKPLWLRNSFWLVPKSAIPGGSDEGFYYVPKPFEIGFVFASLPERMLDAIARSGSLESAAPEGSSVTNEIQRSAADFVKAGLAGTVPLPPAVQAAIESTANYEFFTGRPITPQYLEARAPEYRFGQTTSGVSRLLGRAGAEAGIPVSPQYLDYLTRTFGGTAARRMIQAADVLVQPSPAERLTGAEVLSQISGLSRFTDRPTEVSTTEYDAANLIDRGEQANRDFNRLVRERAPREEIIAMRERYSEELREHNLLTQERTALNRLREERRRVMGDRQMTPEARRRRLDALSERGSRIAEQVFRKLSTSRERNQ